MARTTQEATMRLTISREKLIEGLATINAAIATKTSLPVLGNVLLDADATGLRTTATDLDLTIETTITADVDVPGSATLPAKRLASIAKELPPAPVRIAVAGQRATVDCGRSHFTLLTLPTDEFPVVPKVSYRNDTVKAGVLAEMVKLTKHAVSTEESRPILNGILWEREGECMRLVATNGHRLALAQRKVERSLGEKTKYVIVPPKALDQIGRLFSSDDEITVGVTQGHIGFRSATTTVVSRLIEGPYPAYAPIIPSEFKCSVVADRVALGAAASRCAHMATTESHRLIFDVANGAIGISAMSPDVGDASDTVGVRITGTPIRIGINAHYLADTLAAVGTDEVLMQLVAPERPIVFTPQGSADRANDMYIVMPIRVLD